MRGATEIVSSVASLLPKSRTKPALKVVEGWWIDKCHGITEKRAVDHDVSHDQQL